MQNKIKFILVSIIVFIVVSLIALFIKVQFFTVSATQDENRTSANEQSYEYMMKELDGKIGIYQDDKLINTLDVLVSTLPEYDINLLNEGILIKDLDELRHLIEAFDS